MSLQDNVAQSIKWSFFGEVIARVFTPIVFLSTRRYISPEEFGIFVYAIIVINFSQIFWGGSLSKVIIQKQENVEESSNVIFWLNFTIGFLFFLILTILAPWLSIKIQTNNPKEDFKYLIIILGLIIFISATSSVQNALLQKQFKYKELFWIRLITVAIPGLVTIPMAIYGNGVWALVLGSLATQILQSIYIWTKCNWYPKLSFNIKLFSELMQFGKWIFLSSIMIWFYSWVDAIIIGLYLSKNELAIYNSGNTFTMMIYGFIFSPIFSVLFNAFSIIQNDIEKIKIKLNVIIKAVALISIPIGVCLFALQNEIGKIFFNDQWYDISGAIGILGLMHGFAWVISPNLEAFRAIGKPEIETKILGICLTYYLIIYLIVIQFGFYPFLWARFFLSLSAICIHVYFAKVVFKISIGEWIKILIKPLIISSLLFILINISINWFAQFQYWYIGYLLLILMFYSGLVYFFDKKFIRKEVIPILKKSIKK